jgi:hypothetical protein
MISPVITHAPCSLDQERRIREARAASLARMFRRRRPARRGGRRAPSADLLRGLGLRGEDVWGALRV